MNLVFKSIILLLLISCGSNQSSEINFYYWKTQFKLDNLSRQAIKESNSQKIYLRYFDIIMQDGRVVPNEKIRFSDSFMLEKVCIPVIYIKNQVFELKEIEIDSIASQTLGLIRQISKSNQIKFTEIQLDCDWTITTRERYFTFIKAIKKRDSQLQISTTIRLHQVKYKETTGIPPSDKFVLMYYNIGDLTDKNQNSIFNLKNSKKYSKYIADYPQNLSFALPIFSWAVQYRNDKVIKLISSSSRNEFENPKIYSKLNNLLFQVEISHFYHGTYFMQGDIIKLEYISKSDLEDLKSEISSNYKKPIKEYIYYHLDSTNLINFEMSDFK